MEYLPHAPLRTLPDRFRLYFYVCEYVHVRFQKG